MTSPPARVERAWKTPSLVPGAKVTRFRITSQRAPLTPVVRSNGIAGSNVVLSIISLRNRTEPSAKANCAPPGWKLDADRTAARGKNSMPARWA
jgi:hypothetical protein